MPRKRRQGRPVIYKLAQRRKLAALIEAYGARGAKRLAEKPVSLETVLKIAHEFKIELKKGRRPNQAA